MKWSNIALHAYN